jgi:serine/threonine-protein kinase PknK
VKAARLRVTRRRVAALGAAVVVLALLKVATGIGPALPGPNVSELLGNGDDRPVVHQCVASAARTRTPGKPHPPRGRWRTEPAAPDARSELEEVALDGRVYLIGGQGPNGRSLATVVAFDPARGTYTRLPDMPERVDHALVLSHGGSIYVVGGYVDSEPTNRAWRYTPPAGWTKLPPLRTARGGLAGGVIGDRLYAVAGAPRTFPEYDRAPYSSLEVFDFRSGRWSSGPPIPTARHHTAAAVVDGRLYVAGGRTPKDFSSAAFERFDPRTGRWTRLPGMPLGVGGLAAVAADGRFVAIGGDDETNVLAGQGWVTGSVWAFDPHASRWSRLPNLGIPRHAHAAAVAGGRIYVFEGAPCPGFGRMRGAESLPLPLP